MPIHRIRLLGDPVLRTRCELITKPKSLAARVVVDDLPAGKRVPILVKRGDAQLFLALALPTSAG